MKLRTRLHSQFVLLIGVWLVTAQLTAAQDLISAESLLGGSSVFVFRPARKFFTRPPAHRPKNVSSRAKAKAPIEEDAPEDWINEDADLAIAERKVSDSEPFLSLQKGFLNSRAYFCETPQFPTKMRRAGRKSADLELRVTVAQYGGLLQATVTAGDAGFRNEVYRTLGSMNFRESRFLGEQIRIEGALKFTQKPDNKELCRNTTQQAEVPAVIDGGTLNARLKEPLRRQLLAAGSDFKGAIEVIIGETGNILMAKVISGDRTLGDKVTAGARSITFPRSTIAGTPVKVRGLIDFTRLTAAGV
jgi:hypothetical protein